MNTLLWDKIVQFDLDAPISEYDFSTRLAKENFWTINFTKKAILEYKKFMYLAATSNTMVSPSEIVDIVWHQHLIFTKSYQDFCSLLGKNIQHIPSTHNKEDFLRFRNAKEYTKSLYEKEFGEQNKSIWEYTNMFQSLNLEKAKHKLQNIIWWGFLAFLLSIPVFVFLLKPLFIQIHNPIFLISYVGLFIFAWISLSIYSKIALTEMIKKSDSDSFLFDLTPFELAHLRKRNLDDVIHGKLYNLIRKGAIIINKDNKLKAIQKDIELDKEQWVIMNELTSLKKSYYPPLFKILIQKEIFTNYKKWQEAFSSYYLGSKKFIQIFCVNFITISFILTVGYSRMVLGIMREKPFYLILFFLVWISLTSIIYLVQLTTRLERKIIPLYYKNEVISQPENAKDWNWEYSLLGAALFSSSFTNISKNASGIVRGDGTGGSCSSCGGSSCGGSSCGSSCGGCGGD